jgi:hypothetical protein
MFFILFVIFLAGFFEGAMDTLQFHYYESIFKDFKNQLYWNPEVSWKNKYKNGNPTEGPKFIFSTNFLVSLTDGWHTFKLLRNICLFLFLPIIGFYINNINMLILMIFISRTIYGLGFWLSYYKILIKR